MKFLKQPFFTPLIFSATLFCVWGMPITVSAATLVSNGSSSDVAAKVASAVDGDVITIPAGNFSWTSTIVISGKGVKIQGAGAGRVIARSKSVVTCGTGTKTFALHASGLPISVGQTLRIERTGSEIVGGNATGKRTWMQGTVTSYSGTTLTMNITNSANPVTQGLWIVSTLASTTIVNATNNGSLMSITEGTRESTEISGVRIVSSGSGENILVYGSTNGKPVLFHDLYFEIMSSGSVFRMQTNKGVIWNCSFTAFPYSMNATVLHHKGCPPSSWTSPSTMGSADVTGTSNVYVEDCDFHAWLNSGDCDDNARSVMRRNLFNNAGLGSHGADTSSYGGRHYEVYDNTFVFDDLSSTHETLNVCWWFYGRGGTGVFTDNIMPPLTSQDYGTKTAFNFTVMNLTRNGGPNPLWGAGIAGVQYPAPRQIGMGYKTGAAGTDSVSYKGDSEPIYIWNNTGSTSVNFTDYDTSVSNSDRSADYIVAGRDFFNNGTPKPGYTKYNYPHPLRSGSVPSQPPSTELNAPSNARVSVN